MAGKSRFYSKLHSTLTALEHWQTFLMRRQGISWRTYLQLDQPWLRAMDFHTILDVGANVGNWARTIHALFPAARIYAFEPLPESFSQLDQVAKAIPQIAPLNLALGNENGEIRFYRDEYSPSSSALPMHTHHREAFPYTGKTSETIVPVSRLDDLVCHTHMELQPEILIKMDVQGYEDKVIDGAEQTLLKARLLVIETAFDELYQGQALFDGIYARLTRLGFGYCGSLAQLESPRNGRVLQQDSLFVRQ